MADRLSPSTVLAWLAWTLIGCGVELAPPDGVAIHCHSDDECPDGSYLCNEEIERCFAVGVNAPPSLLVRPIARAVQTLVVGVQIIDSNAAPNGDDRVTVDFEYTTAPDPRTATTWWPAVDDTGSSQLVDLSELGVAVVHPFEWSLLTQSAYNDETATDGGLDAADTTNLTSDAGEDRAVDIISTVPTVTVRARAVDRHAASSGWVVSNTVMVGNDAPTVTLAGPTQAPLGGLVPLELRVVDSAADSAWLTVEFCLPSECAGSGWRPAAIGMGATTAIGTSREGVTHVVAWNSGAPTAAAVDAPAQGIGAAALSGVRVRTRACDSPADITDNTEALRAGSDQAPAVGYCGAWAETTLPLVDNSP